MIADNGTTHSGQSEDLYILKTQAQDVLTISTIPVKIAPAEKKRPSIMHTMFNRTTSSPTDNDNGNGNAAISAMNVPSTSSLSTTGDNIEVVDKVVTAGDDSRYAIGHETSSDLYEELSLMVH